MKAACSCGDRYWYISWILCI